MPYSNNSYLLLGVTPAQLWGLESQTDWDDGEALQTPRALLRRHGGPGQPLL